MNQKREEINEIILSKQMQIAQCKQKNSRKQNKTFVGAQCQNRKKNKNREQQYLQDIKSSQIQLKIHQLKIEFTKNNKFCPIYQLINCKLFCRVSKIGQNVRLFYMYNCHYCIQHSSPFYKNLQLHRSFRHKISMSKQLTKVNNQIKCELLYTKTFTGKCTTPNKFKNSQNIAYSWQMKKHQSWGKNNSQNSYNINIQSTSIVHRVGTYTKKNLFQIEINFVYKDCIFSGYSQIQYVQQISNPLIPPQSKPLCHHQNRNS
eukprot:TRINITY_DN1432_c0_g1_i5.p2 TRINITY_DN1432_c0_g1~~TRINITY_DN1432_c0_g1_i5.p2  ORF type:complete len:260 (-),score=-19.43 TRINITY_DN1432_c0_g1_i5:456-1235(-)